MALVVAMILVPVLAHVPAEAQQEPSRGSAGEGLQLCLDASGELRGGALDILVLLDDSGSLQQTDPQGLRYEALDELLRELASLGDGPGVRERNIAIVSYGQRADVLLPFRQLADPEIAGIVADVRVRADGRQPYTDFILGVRTALDLVRDRPATNCRIFVWFTDGDHHRVGTPSSVSIEDQRVDADDLRRDFCGPGGLDDRIRELGINTFALMLEPLPTRREALEASKDVLQVITGDATPDFADSAGRRREPTEGCAGDLGPQIGRILPATEASQLPGLLGDLSNELEGAQPGAPLACPYRIDEVTSLKLPDAHLIEWFSLTDFRSSDEVRTPDLRTVVAVTAEGEEIPAAQVLEEVTRSDRVLRVRPRPDVRERLGAGWELRLTQAQELCLRVLPVTLAFRISTSAPSITAVRPADLPEALFVDGRLELLARGQDRSIGLDEALRTPGVSGRLVVDDGMLFTMDGRLPARIIVDGAPVVGEDCGVIQIPAPGTLTAGRTELLGGPEAPRDPLTSSTCDVVPATTGDGGTLVWADALAALNDPAGECRVGDWTVHIDGRPATGDRIELAPGSGAVVLQLRSQNAPDNEERDCIGVVLPGLVLEWQSATTTIPVELSAVWARRSSPLIAGIIATPAVLIVALLSLLLLRMINDRWMRPPDAASLWGYQAEGMLTLDRYGRPRVEWERGSTAFRAKQEALGSVSGEGRDALVLERTRLERRMPGWLRPLDEPVLVVAGSDGIAATHPAALRGRGTLPLGFREAVVLAATTVRVPTPDDPVPVRLIVLVPRSGDVAASDAVERLVQQQVDLLAGRLNESLHERAGTAGSGGSGGEERGPSGPPPGPMGGPPPGPAPVSGPAPGSGSIPGRVAGPPAAPGGPADLPPARRPARRAPTPVQGLPTDATPGAQPGGTHPDASASQGEADDVTSDRTSEE